MGKKAAQRRRRDAGDRPPATVAPRPRAAAATRSAGSAAAAAPTPAALVVCFFLSGAASLMLEVGWTRLLRLVFGSTTLAVSTILVAYMLGLGLGGLAGGRIASRLRRGVATYGWMEIAIGLYALVVPFAIDLFPELHRAFLTSFSFWTGAMARFAVALLLLLPATVLMGATLPILVAAVAHHPGQVGTRVGLLYGMNTLGAVVGVMVTTFVLFPAIGVLRTNAFAAVLDLCVGAIAVFVLAKRYAFVAPAEEPASAPAREEAPAAGWNAALVAYGSVGFTALVYEVCWTRALSMILGSSIYAFATMLAAFLTGISLGSLIGRRWFDRLTKPFAAYALAIGALGLCSLFTVAAFRALPDVFVAVFIQLGPSAIGVTTTSVLLSMLVMLAPTLVLGALFPLLVSALAAVGRDPSKSVGNAYFANTLGSASGAFLAGFVLIPVLGLAQTMGLAVAVNLLTAAGLIVWRGSGVRLRYPLAGASMAAAVAAIVVAPVWWSPEQLTRGVFRSPTKSIDVGLSEEPLDGVPPAEILFYREGINTTVSIHRVDGQIVLRVNGKTDASSQNDMGTQVMAGHVPLLFGGPARRALVIGLASGVSAGSASLHGLERIDIVELEPAIIEASHYFDHVNYRPLDRPEVRVIADDGRNLLATTDERYDVVISEPSNPWITGASSLFTRESFAEVHRALAPGGRLLQWIQLYGLQPDALRSVLAALRAEFDYVYGFTTSDTPTDLLLLATDTPIDAPRLPVWENLSPAIQQDLQRVGIFSTGQLWSLLRLSAEAIDALAAKASAVNTDDNLYVELHAPWALYEEATANLDLLRQRQDGVVRVAEADGTTIDAARYAEVALAYLEAPLAGDLGKQLLAEAGGRGYSAELLVGQALVEEGDFQAALDAAVTAYPTAFEPRWRRARLRVDDGEPEAALDDLQVALAARPDDPRARALHLEILNELGRFEEARQEAEFLRQAPYAQRRGEIFIEIAKAAAGAGDMSAALAELRGYLQRMPADSSAWFILARYLELAGAAEEAEVAEANYRRTLKNLAIGTHADALRAERLGFHEQAVGLLESALEIAPDYRAAEIDLEHLRRGDPTAPR